MNRCRSGMPSPSPIRAPLAIFKIYLDRDIHMCIIILNFAVEPQADEKL